MVVNGYAVTSGQEESADDGSAVVYEKWMHWWQWGMQKADRVRTALRSRWSGWRRSLGQN